MSSFSNYLSSALPRKDIKAATSIAPRPSWFTLKSTSLTEVDADLAVNKSVLYDAASTKAVDSELVVETLLKCERLVKDRNKMGKGQGQDQKEGGRMAMELMRNIVGSWRLIFTTGTIKQQKKTGVKVNYFPLKAVQSFTDAGGITNAIYIGDYPALKFEGCYDLVEVGDSMVRVEFDFDSLILAGFKINLGGNAVDIGEKTGLGSGTGVTDKETKKKKAFFNWGVADEKIATARGGGGGIALWSRVE